MKIREIEKIKKFVDENNNNLFCEVYGIAWLLKNATTKLVEEDDMLVVYEGEPYPENEIFRVNEFVFETPEKRELKSMVKDYLLNKGDKRNTLRNHICYHWTIREYGNNKWLIISSLSIENYLKAIELFDD